MAKGATEVRKMSQGETYPRPWKMVSGGWWNPETNEIHTTESWREWLAANPLAKDVLFIRCMEHRAAPALNTRAFGDAECGQCAVEAERTRREEAEAQRDRYMTQADILRNTIDPLHCERAERAEAALAKALRLRLYASHNTGCNEYVTSDAWGKGCNCGLDEALADTDPSRPPGEAGKE